MNCRRCTYRESEHCPGCSACPEQECPDWCEGEHDDDEPGFSSKVLP